MLIDDDDLPVLPKYRAVWKGFRLVLDPPHPNFQNFSWAPEHADAAAWHVIALDMGMAAYTISRRPPSYLEARDWVRYMTGFTIAAELHAAAMLDIESTRWGAGAAD